MKRSSREPIFGFFFLVEAGPAPACCSCAIGRSFTFLHAHRCNTQLHYISFPSWTVYIVNPSHFMVFLIRHKKWLKKGNELGLLFRTLTHSHTHTPSTAEKIRSTGEAIFTMWFCARSWTNRMSINSRHTHSSVWEKWKGKKEKKNKSRHTPMECAELCATTDH